MVVALADGALRLNLLFKFVEKDLAVTVLVELLKHLIGLFLCDIEAAALKNTHQLMGLNSAI